MEHDTEEAGLQAAAGDEERESAQWADQRQASEPDEMPDAFEPDEMPYPADALGTDEVCQSSTRSAEQREATGEPRVDEALSRLDELAELPVSEHPEVFEHVHARLRDVLGELDSDTLAGAQGRQGR
jgi:hypothetical protein